MQAPNTPRNSIKVGILSLLAGVVFGLLLLSGIGFAIIVARSSLGTLIGRGLNALFAADTVQAMWYVTRSAGIVAYLLLWLSTVWGLAVKNKILDAIMHRAFTYDFHQFLSLLAIGFTILHIAVLLVDQYTPFSLAQILIPFIDPYRPLWVGIGVIGLYGTLLVTITFYIRRRIGQRAFRVIHYTSLIAYLMVTIHSLYSGTDSPLAATQLMYAGTFLVVVFLTVYWLVLAMGQGRIRSAEPQPDNTANRSVPAKRSAGTSLPKQDSSGTSRL